MKLMSFCFKLIIIIFLENLFTLKSKFSIIIIALVDDKMEVSKSVDKLTFLLLTLPIKLLEF